MGNFLAISYLSALKMNSRFRSSYEFRASVYYSSEISMTQGASDLAFGPTANVFPWVSPRSCALRPSKDLRIHSYAQNMNTFRILETRSFEFIGQIRLWAELNGKLVGHENALRLVTTAPKSGGPVGGGGFLRITIGNSGVVCPRNSMHYRFRTSWLSSVCKCEFVVGKYLFWSRNSRLAECTCQLENRSRPQPRRTARRAGWLRLRFLPPTEIAVVSFADFAA